MFKTYWPHTQRKCWSSLIDLLGVCVPTALHFHPFRTKFLSFSYYFLMKSLAVQGNSGTIIFFTIFFYTNILENIIYLQVVYKNTFPKRPWYRKILGHPLSPVSFYRSIYSHWGEKKCQKPWSWRNNQYFSLYAAGICNSARQQERFVRRKAMCKDQKKDKGAPPSELFYARYL